VFTNNGKFLYVTKPLGQFGFGTGTNVDAFRVERDGTLTLIDSQMTSYNAIDDALSHDSRFLYVLSDALTTPGTSQIDEFAIDPGKGTLALIGELIVPGATNSTAGLAAW
jgi:6-phosphogluconolactonase (cycloisomerase 2 family)